MDSSVAHSPVFLIFPPEVVTPESESTDLSAATYGNQSPLQKLFATKMKILGFISSGAFLIALKRKTTETLMIMSRIMNFLSALGAIAGIVLLAFGFLLDRNYICGYSPENSQCDAITVLFI
ncbi:membrane-spanning 4-domains subfamily A member 5, partial [Daubentonia madagascariensis]